MKAPVIAGCKLWIGNKRKRQAKKKVKWFIDNIKKVQQASNYMGIKYTDYYKGYLVMVWVTIDHCTYNWGYYKDIDDSFLGRMLDTCWRKHD